MTLQRLIELEVENKRLREALSEVHSATGAHGLNVHDLIAHIAKISHETLTNTTQAAKKARDAVRREVIGDIYRDVKSASIPDRNADQIWSREFQEGRSYGLSRALGIIEALKTQEGK